MERCHGRRRCVPWSPLDREPEQEVHREGERQRGPPDRRAGECLGAVPFSHRRHRLGQPVGDRTNDDDGLWILVRNALEATAFLKDLAGLAEARRANAGLPRRSATREGGSAGPAGSAGRTDGDSVGLVTCPTPWNQQVVCSSTCPGRTDAFLLPTPTRRGWERPRPCGVAGVAPILATLMIATDTAYLARARSGRRSMRSGRKRRAQGQSRAEVAIAAWGARARAESSERASHLPVSSFARRLCATSVPKQS